MSERGMGSLTQARSCIKVQDRLAVGSSTQSRSRLERGLMRASRQHVPFSIDPKDKEDQGQGGIVEVVGRTKVEQEPGSPGASKGAKCVHCLFWHAVNDGGFSIGTRVSHFLLRQRGEGRT